MADNVIFNALASTRRRHLLDTLRGVDEPLDVTALVAATGLHANTIRFHLDVLIRSGLVRERSDRRGTRGRPRLGYVAATQAVSTSGYHLLAQVLVTHLEQTDDGAAAETAGVAWAQRLWPHPPGAQQELESLATAVAALFAEMGFDPTVESDTGRRRILLHACPFWSLAEAHPGVVCAVHRGLLRGLADRAGRTDAEVRLIPFIQPRLCQAELIDATAEHL
ncbi:helix-turn-helix transcriptional regulator [Actinoplanes sp. GCM10030250]|uniref:helix-turn-helix transcriptional regulator n=1 Tax=Actinoplanes sp. GCM10030250 TaxID=3273376 RepID=UPI00362447F7